MGNPFRLAEAQMPRPQQFFRTCDEEMTADGPVKETGWGNPTGRQAACYSKPLSWKPLQGEI